MSNKKNKKMPPQPLSKKQRKKLEKRGISVGAAAAVKVPRAPLSVAMKEKILFFSLLSALCIVAILCATFGGILLSDTLYARRVGPYASAYEYLNMGDFMKTSKLGASFYTGNAIEYGSGDYTAKTMTYMDEEYIPALLLENRVLVKEMQRDTVLGIGDTMYAYITEVYQGETRIRPDVLPSGFYSAFNTQVVGEDWMGDSFTKALLDKNLKPTDTWREVRYNGQINDGKGIEDLVYITYSVYEKKGESSVQNPESDLEKYTWKTSASESKSSQRVDFSKDDVEAVLAQALKDNCPGIGEQYVFVLNNYKLGETKTTCKVVATVHFAIEEEEAAAITFTLPDRFFGTETNTSATALNNKEVTFKIVVNNSDDYELPTLDRTFITETLKVAVKATDDEGAVNEFKALRLAEINEEIEATRKSDMVKQVYLYMMEKATSSNLYYSQEQMATEASYSKIINNEYAASIQELQNNFIRAYGYAPDADTLNSYAQALGQQMGMQIETYQQYASQWAISNFSQNLMMYYIFRDAGIDLTEEELTAAYDEYIAELLEADEDEEHDAAYYVELLGGESAIYKEIRRDLVYEKVGDYLIANNSVSEKK